MKAVGHHEFVESLDGAQLRVWFQHLDPNGDRPLAEPVLRVYAEGVEHRNEAGQTWRRDIGRTEFMGAPRTVETGPMLSGYRVVEDLVGQGEWTKQDAAEYARLSTKLLGTLVVAAQVTPPTAEEIAATGGMADALGAAEVARQAQAEAAQLRASREADLKAARDAADAKVAAARAQARKDVDQLVADRKAAEATALAERKAREQAEAEAEKAKTEAATERAHRAAAEAERAAAQTDARSRAEAEAEARKNIAALKAQLAGGGK